MAVTATSYRSYRELLDTGKVRGQQFKILNAMREGRAYTRRELTALTGLEINAVCGRVNELLQSGALVKAHEVKDPVTHQTVETVALNVGERQQRLFLWDR